MKKVIYLALALCTLGACNDGEFLKEDADDFLTVDNSYLNAALTTLPGSDTEIGKY